MDIPAQGTHKCPKMPEDEFAEINATLWHIHKIGQKHSAHIVYLEDGLCPYCGTDLLGIQAVGTDFWDEFDILPGPALHLLKEMAKKRRSSGCLDTVT